MTTLSFAPFTHLRSNLKTDLDIDLNNLTFICGPNRSHKTSIRQSIRLAVERSLLVHNRKSAITAASRLLTFAANPADGIQIELQSASGFLYFDLPINEETGNAREIRPRRVTGDLATLTDEDWKQCFPMDTVRELLSFDARQTRQAILRIFAPAGTSFSPPLGLSDLQKELWNLGLKTVDASDAITALTALSAWAHKEKPLRTKQANTQEKNLESLKALATTPGLETLEALEKQLLEAEKAELQQRQVKPELSSTALTEQLSKASASLKLLREDAVTVQLLLDQDIATAKGKLEEVKASQAKAYESSADVNERIQYARFLLRDLDNRIAQGFARCPFDHPCDVEVLKNQRRIIAEKMEKRQQEWDDAVASQGRLSLALVKANSDLEIAHSAKNQALHDFEVKKATLQATIKVLSGQLEQFKEDTSASSILTSSYSGLPATELRPRVELLRKAKTARGQYETSMAQVRRLHEESAALKVIEGEAQEIMQGLLLQCKENAEARINPYMAEGFRAELNLTEGDCEFRVIGNDGCFYDASASGSELGSLIIALAACLPGKFKILDLDDSDLHAFDPVNIKKLWKALEKALHDGVFQQVVVVHNRLEEGPSRKDGWMWIEQVKTTVEKAQEVAPVDIDSRKTLAPLDEDLVNALM